LGGKGGRSDRKFCPTLRYEGQKFSAAAASVNVGVCGGGAGMGGRSLAPLGVRASRQRGCSSRRTLWAPAGAPGHGAAGGLCRVFCGLPVAAPPLLAATRPRSLALHRRGRRPLPERLKGVPCHRRAFGFFNQWRFID